MGNRVCVPFGRFRWLAAVVAVGFLAAAPARAADIEVLEAVAPGSVAPDFTLSDTNGKSVSLSDFAGKITLLTFWSCYTDTCFTTVKVFEDLLARLGPLGLVAPTVCEEIPPALAADNYAGLLKRCSTGQTVLLDPEREVRGRYRIRQLPTSILIGSDMRVVEIVRGVPTLRDPALHERIEKLVRAAATAPK
ncbi:MAG: peroxiredoxin family protein [Candidatus Methylomirabilia bacterium]